LLTVIGVLNVAGALHASPEYCATRFRLPGIGMLMLAAAVPTVPSEPLIASTVEPSKKVMVPVGAVEVPHAEPVMRA
jgi:hypothetical protein